MWMYQGKQITELSQIENILGYTPYGFIYNIVLYYEGISYEYIGKKNLYSIRTKRVSKKQLKERGKSAFRRKKQKKGKDAGEWYYYEMNKTEMKWRDYNSSSKKVIEMINNGAVFTKYILEFVEKESEMIYQETKHQFCSSVLEENRFLNDSILNRFYKKNIINKK